MFFETIAKFDTFQFFVGYLTYVVGMRTVKSWKKCTEANLKHISKNNSLVFFIEIGFIEKDHFGLSDS